MKLSILIIFSLILYANCDPKRNFYRINNLTLTNGYNKHIRHQSLDGIYDPFRKFFININYDCIEAKIKLHENGEKEMSSTELEVLMTKSLTSCSEYGEQEFWKIFVTEVSNSMKSRTVSESRPCLSLALHNLNANSKLIENFDPKSLSAEDINYCNTQIRIIDSDIQQETESRVNIDELQTLTCGALNYKEIREAYYTMMIVGSVDDEQLKSSEINKFSQFAVGKVDNIFNCIMARSEG